MSVANAPFVGNARPAVHDMAVDDATTNPTESQFGGHATEMETEAVSASQPVGSSTKVWSKKGKGKGKASGTAYQLAGRATKATKGKSKAATVGGSASQPLCNARGMATETTKAARRTSSSQPITGIASRIRAHQAERRASERLRGYVGSGQPAREPIMVDLTIEEAAPETRTSIRCAWGNPGARGRESSLQQLLYLPQRKHSSGCKISKRRSCLFGETKTTFSLYFLLFMMGCVDVLKRG
ncbi:hypothetical protein CJ030_MR7G000898 [Morella rubra]|uniref:Uncharacterized protein n=1 Tax=Morella rubra TaxID=262757 RepID=A0A6A1UYZ5_9ROSI|nr:hypothetical protein CJ030_MR7G000898 [Morella rubra]